MRNMMVAMLCALLLIPMSSRAQSASPTPASSTTAPVSAPPKPVPCTSEQHRQFDFWIGDWEVTGADGKLAGRNTIHPILGGCVLHESWKAGSGYAGESFNTYDRARQVWHQTWVDVGGSLLVLEGQFADGVMTLSDRALTGKKDPHAINEIAWTKRADGSVKQLWRVTRNGGKTWTTAFDGTYIGASASTR